MRDQHILGFLRIDVHAAGNDHVGLAIGQIEEAVFVEIADIAERRPASAVVGAFRLLRIVVIGKRGTIGEIDRADPSGRQFLIVLPENPGLADDGAADGAAVRQPLLRGRHRDAVALGAAVILDQDRSPPFDHRGLDVDRAGRRGMDCAFQRRDIVAAPHVVGQFEYADEHGRYELGLRDPMFLDQAQKFLGVEGFHDHGRAAENGHHHVEAQRSGMVERGRREVDAVRIHAAHVGAQNPQERIRHVDRAALERLLDALGTAGGAGRIKHVIARDFVRDRRGRLRTRLLVPGAEAGQRFVQHEESRLIRRAGDEPFDVLGAFRRGNDDLGAAILDDIGDLILREVAADRGVVEPAALRGPAYLHERQPVLDQKGDVVAGFQPERPEQMRALVG